MHIQVEALGYQNYNGKWYVCGETIPVLNESDVADMEAMHLGKRRPTPARGHDTRDMTPEAEASVLPTENSSEAKEAPPSLPKRGQYLTRAARKR